jgi:prepilin-type N-terminal cleavage/methylation domain-containing protein
MSPTGRPEGESLSAPREGNLMSPTGRPEGESLSAQRDRRQGNANAPGRGFTLIEVLVATAAAAVLSALLLTMWLQAVQSGNRAETERRLAALREAFALHYHDHVGVIEARPDAALVLEAGSGLAIASGTDLTPEALGALQGQLGLALGDSSRDGHGTAFRLYVTGPLAGQLDGISVSYRRIAIVSAGRNQRFETIGWDPLAGRLTPGGDDQVVHVDGMALQRPQLTETRRRVQKLAALITGYATARFLANAARDPNVNYFGAMPAGSTQQPWDDAPDNVLARRSAKSLPGLSGAELATLGLTAAEALDAWGGAIDFDNDGADVRHPSNPVAALATPPFTARLTVTLPGGGQYVETLLGAF